MGGVEGVESEFFLKLEGEVEGNLDKVLDGMVVGVVGVKGEVIRGYLSFLFFPIFYLCSN